MVVLMRICEISHCGHMGYAEHFVVRDYWTRSLS
jgi:hypothetical protein